MRVLDATGRQVGDVIGIAGDAAGYFYPEVLLHSGSAVFVLQALHDYLRARDVVLYTTTDCTGIAYVTRNSSMLCQ